MADETAKVVQTWGYANQGARSHILDPVEMPGADTWCCHPGNRCCFFGIALCGATLAGSIREQLLEYWVPCHHCLKKAAPGAKESP